MIIICGVLLSGCAVFEEGVKTLAPTDNKESSESNVVEVPETIDEPEEVEEIEEPGSHEGAGEYSINVMDLMMRECNVACCGEETPVSCDDECRWPEYIDCFHGCIEDHPDTSYNCDAQCWPEHKAYFEEKTAECQE